MGAYRKYDNAMKAYEQAKKQYTGTQGYKNALSQGIDSAAKIAEAQSLAAQQQARQAGMTKAQAATLGANQAQSNLANAITNQQSSSYNAGKDSMDANVKTAEMAQNQINQGWDAAGKIVGSVGQGIAAGATISDERLKEIFGIDDDSKLDELKQIRLYKFKYNDEAQDNFGEEFHVDDCEHEGVMAQDIEKIVPTAVKEIDGKKVVDTKELVMALTGIVAELARKLDEK